MNSTEQPAVVAPVEASVRPCAWWVRRFGFPLVGRGDAKPMLWPDAEPLYDQAAMEAAVAAERERWLQAQRARAAKA